MCEFSGKTVLITGAAQGVGRETAILFAEKGSNVFMTDINIDSLKSLKRDLENRDANVFAYYCDISNIESIEEMINSANKKYGKIDFLVNNAGVVVTKKIMDLKEVDWDKVLSVNVKGTFFVLLNTAKSMIEKKIKGSIINIASIAGEKSRPNFLTYAASKAAIINFTKSTALEFSKFGIRVNAISPGTIDTPMWSEIAGDVAKIENLEMDELQDNWIKRIPLGRLALPGDIANIILFLCSDKASYITGQVINVCGGLSII
jgi:NAD(P)-dependent dehydrogenase (short-subunit alcohol dehydrogenase family)